MRVQAIVLFFLTVLAWLLEGSFFSHWTLWGVKPDLILVLLVLTLLFRGAGYGMLVAVVGGMLRDTYLMTQGFYLLFYLGIVPLVAPFLAKMYEDWMILALLTMGVTFMENLGFFLFLLASGVSPSPIRLFQILPAQILFNLGILFFFYSVLRYGKLLIAFLREGHGAPKAASR